MAKKIEEIVGQLAGELVANVLKIPRNSDYVHPSGFVSKTIDAEYTVRDRSWRLHQLIGEDVRSLIGCLESSLRRLTHTTTSTVEYDHTGNVRGKIDIKGTGRLRGRRGSNPLLVAYERPEPTSGVPENRLLKWVLENIREDAGSLRETLSSSGIKDRLSYIYEEVTSALRHPYIEPLTVPDYPSQRMVDSARRSRVEAYHYAVEFYEKRRSLKDDSLDAFIEVVSESYIYPSKNDKIFEFYVLVMTILCINGSYDKKWSKVEIGRQGGPVAKFRANDLEVTVNYDRSILSSIEWCKSGMLKYNEFFDRYEGVSVSSRRPDVVVEVRSKSGVIPLILEAKWTNSEGYIRDSMYKVLGYISDFEEIWEDGSVVKGYPKAVLFIEDGLRPNSEQSWESSLRHSDVGVLTYEGGHFNALSDLFSRLFEAGNSLDYLPQSPAD